MIMMAMMMMDIMIMIIMIMIVGKRYNVSEIVTFYIQLTQNDDN